MKLKKGLKLRKAGKKYMIVTPNYVAPDCVGEDSEKMLEVFSLNESAAYLWDLIGDSEIDVQFLADSLSREYQVELSRAQADVENAIKVWKEFGLVVDL